MVVDVFTYNGEADILEIRLHILNDKVGQFVVVEAPTTFSGKPKPLYFERDRERFKEFLPKIKYFVIDENYSPEEIAIAEESPNTKGADHWKREFLQKESIKKALTHLDDNDIVYVGDVDEIWNEVIDRNDMLKLKLRVYPYFLNNRSNEEFWGTVVCKYWHIRMHCLNHLRTNCLGSDHYHGWHFTSQGGLDEVRRKLNDSYTKESYNTDEVQLKLAERMLQNKDYIGRGFTFERDDKDLPDYIKINWEKYVHMLR